MTTLILAFCSVVLIIMATLVLAIAVGGPGLPAPLSHISASFKRVDYSDLPALQHYTVRDGTRLAYRAYPAATDGSRGSVVLVHGSSAHSMSMHVMAKAFASAGINAYALDMRGHGESGIRGYISYVGQLEDDLEDFHDSVQPAQPARLGGFSAGGGFVLRFAGSARQKLFAGYLLLAPFLGQNAPTYRPDSGGWVSVGLPRFLAIHLLNALNLRLFKRLPVLRYALTPEAHASMTPAYSYDLAYNFRALPDFRANIRAVQCPLQVLVGQDDEQFDAGRFAEVFATANSKASITVLPGVAHIPLTLDDAALQAAVSAVSTMA